MPQKSIIGRDTFVDFGDKITGVVPAKVDTGADGSAVWASDIFVDKTHKLHFKLFGKDSPFYTGEEHIVEEYMVTLTKSASGDVVMKYKVKIPVTIEGRHITVNLGLSDRSTHNYPILIGLRTLKGKFIVDVSREAKTVIKEKKKSLNLNKKMRENPYKFYKEQYLNGSK